MYRALLRGKKGRIRTVIVEATRRGEAEGLIRKHFSSEEIAELSKSGPGWNDLAKGFQDGFLAAEMDEFRREAGPFIAEQAKFLHETSHHHDGVRWQSCDHEQCRNAAGFLERFGFDVWTMIGLEEPDGS